MEEGNNTVFLVAGYEMNEEEQTTLLQEPAFNKYHTIAKSGLTAALKEYYAAATNAEKGWFWKGFAEWMDGTQKIRDRYSRLLISIRPWRHAFLNLMSCCTRVSGATPLSWTRARCKCMNKFLFWQEETFFPYKNNKCISPTTIPALPKGEQIECIYIIDVSLKKQIWNRIRTEDVFQ